MHRTHLLPAGPAVTADDTAAAAAARQRQIGREQNQVLGSKIVANCSRHKQLHRAHSQGRAAVPAAAGRADPRAARLRRLHVLCHPSIHYHGTPQALGRQDQAETSSFNALLFCCDCALNALPCPALTHRRAGSTGTARWRACIEGTGNHASDYESRPS